MSDEIKETIREALRMQFDNPKTTANKSIELMEAMQDINHEAYLEMKSDLLSEGIIKENY